MSSQRTYLTLRHSLFMTLVLLMLNDISVTAQSFVDLIDSPGSQDNTYTDVYPLKNGGVLYMHFSYTNVSNQQKDTLHIQEYDDCGLIKSSMIHIDHLFSIRYITDFKEKGDSIYILLRGQAESGIHPYSEAGFLVLDRQTLAGDYHFVRHGAGFTGFSIDFDPSGNLLLYGVYSTINQPSRYTLIQFDEKYSILNQKHFYGSFSLTGWAKSVTNGILCRTDKELFMLDQNLQAQWSREFGQISTGEHVFEIGNGYLLPFQGWYGDRRLAVLHLDDQGNVLNQTDNLSDNLSSNLISKFIQFDEQTYVLVSQNLDVQNILFGPIEINVLNENLQLKKQYKLDLKDLDQDFRFHEACVSGASIWISGVLSARQAFIVKTDLGEGSCYLSEFNFSSPDSVQPLKTSLTPPQAHDLSVSTGSYNILSRSWNIPNQRVCEPIYPAYDLLADDTVLCAGQKLILDLNGIVDAMRWEDSTTIKTRTIDSAGIYYYSYGNCPRGIAESIKVTFEDCKCNVYIPNAFSPNNDGVNDVFIPFYSCTEISDFHMTVYDRWGAIVFESKDADFGWNGTFSGTPCEPGLYLYTLIYRDDLTIDNELFKIEGEVSLLK